MKFPRLVLKPLALFEFASTLRLSLFLIICLILGGTSQDIVTPKLPLYLVSLFVIGGCLTALKPDSQLWKLKPLLVFFVVIVVVQLAYLVPLPPSIWTELNGREFIAQGFETLGTELPWLPLSVTPEKTLFSLFDFFPPLALVLLMGTVVSPKEFRTALWSLGFFVIISSIIGMMQVTGNMNMYFYEFTNNRSAVGFFSNANHYALFLLMSIPLITCLADQKRIIVSEDSGRLVIFSIVVIFAALLGIGLSGSLAGFLLIIPVLSATLFVWSKDVKIKNIYLVGIFASLILVLLFDVFIWNDMQSEISRKFSSIDTSTRRVMFENTYQISKEFFPFGSGLGSFSDVYRLVEDAGPRTIPHAHNEYIEIISEIGIFGIFTLVFLFFWIGKNIFKAIFSQGVEGNSAKFMSIPIVSIGIHSIFEFSLRTMAIMTFTVFVICSLNLLNKNVPIIND